MHDVLRGARGGAGLAVLESDALDLHHHLPRRHALARTRGVCQLVAAWPSKRSATRVRHQIAV